MQYLVDRSPYNRGAHFRYMAQGELDIDNITGGMARLHKERPNKFQEWLQKFEQAAEKFPPVMRHFFTERYHEPALW